MRILGINAYHPDASVVLLEDGQPVWAAEEERFDRVKHSWGFPTLALRRCLAERQLRLEDLDYVAVGKDSRANRLYKLRYFLSNPPTPTFLANCWKILRKGAGLDEAIARAAGVSTLPASLRIIRVEHHRAHAASCFFVSPFDRACFLSLDGLGDFSSALWGIGDGIELTELGRVRFPHSAGFLYTAGTQFLGFSRYGDEYKVMGLAAWGRPRYQNVFRRMLRLDRDGGFRLNLDYFLQHKSRARVFLDWQLRLYSNAWVEQLGEARRAEDALEPRHWDIAASLQAVTEELYLHILNHLQRATGEKRLCLAGGVAFNSRANGRILGATPFEEVFIQPAAGDAGTALGAASWVHHQLEGRPRSFVMRHAYLGTEPDEERIRTAMKRASSSFEKLDDESLVERCAETLAAGRVVGWLRGRMEFGPRALGNRSIFADPRNADTGELLNRKIKHREPFRPFAPAVIAEEADRWFEMHGHPSPFMLRVVSVRDDRRARIPAVTHVDGTARVQTVDRETNPLFWSLLRAFARYTGVPILLNTSFNDNEPIIESPEQALECFARSGLDALVLGSFYIES